MKSIAGLALLLIAAPPPLDAQVRVDHAVHLAAVPEQDEGEPNELLAAPARLQVKRMPLAKALKRLQESSSVRIAYSPDLVPAERRVTCDCAGATVGEALHSLLGNTPFEFVVAAEQVVIRRRPNPEVRLASMELDRSVARAVGEVRRSRLRVAGPFKSPRRSVQQGSITGIVRDAGTGEPLPTVQMYIPALEIGVLTQQNGRYLLQGVPEGTHRLTAERIGYTAITQEVTVTEGETVAADFDLEHEPLMLEEIVATGLVDPVAGVRAPISVRRVDREAMPVMVSSGDVVENLAGRMAGVRVNRTTGQPGEGVTLMLRSPTTLRGSGAPLIVVDGVVLSGEEVPSTVDLEGNDIESIEVIRGAAASSLYGSRAAAGVVEIRTARGNNLAEGQTRFTARTEYGISQNVSNVELNNSHAFLMNESRTAYVDEDGNEVPRDARVLPPLDVAFMDKAYPGEVYDNFDAILHAGRFLSNNFSIMGNEGNTNFAVSFNNLDEEGILVGHKGYERNSFRVNVDHRFRESLSLGVSMSHSREWRDNLVGDPLIVVGGSNDASPVTQVLYGPRDVDLNARDEDGDFIQQPDPTVPYQNPVWTQATRDYTREGSRTLGSLDLSWSPLPWFSASAILGYDRGDRETREYLPKGTPADIGNPGQLDGAIGFQNRLSEAYNASAQLTLRRDIGLLNLRTTFRGLIERDRLETGERSGEGFIIEGIPQLSNIRPEDQRAVSYEQEIRAVGYLWDTALDYDGKYIFTVLGRRDGSSLFGPDNRWHNYYRIAGAWRMAQEPWFNIPNINELKLSYAQGTAGERPRFSYQYETWDLQNGIPTKNTLGNRRLAPQHTTEREFSLDLIVFDRFGISLTHARQQTKDQLNPVPLPGLTGYGSQWINAGAISGHSTELEFEAQLIQRPTFSWTSMVIADYSNAHISQWDIPCYAQGWRWNCQDIPVYGIYSRWLVKDRDGMNQHDGGIAVPHADEFEVNDEGFLVWVGDGNHYWEGVEKGLWGTESEFTNSQGEPYKWGHPFFERTELGTPHRTLLGEGVPANFGWVNNIRWGAFDFHMHLHASIGGQTNNRRFQFMANTDRATAPFMDQSGKPDGLKKPISYYRSAIDGDNSYTIEDSSYLKMRTMSLGYRMTRDQLSRFGLTGLAIQDLRLGVIVRNVFTITNYDGFDPEGGLNLNTRRDADESGYPPTRNLTAEIAVTF